MSHKVVLLGYSGHGYIAADIFEASHIDILGYCEVKEKEENPYDLLYLGDERSDKAVEYLKKYDHFISIGDNLVRRKISEATRKISNKSAINAIHPRSVLSKKINLGHGVMIGPSAVINSMSTIGNGVICNTNTVIEHECNLGNFSHIAPGTVLCGNVTVGNNTFVGAGSVVRQGIIIGNNVIIGAGTTVVKNIPDNTTVIGNPARVLKK